jgi:hypothetical protein
MTDYKKNQTMFAVFLTIGFIFLAIGILSIVENLHMTYMATLGLPFYILAGGFRKKMKESNNG